MEKTMTRKWQLEMWKTLSEILGGEDNEVFETREPSENTTCRAAAVMLQEQSQGLKRTAHDQASVTARGNLEE